MEETEGLEPSTLSFEARRSDSIELRLRVSKVVASGRGQVELRDLGWTNLG